GVAGLDRLIDRIELGGLERAIGVVDADHAPLVVVGARGRQRDIVAVGIGAVLGLGRHAAIGVIAEAGDVTHRVGLVRAPTLAVVQVLGAVVRGVDHRGELAGLAGAYAGVILEAVGMAGRVGGAKHRSGQRVVRVVEHE